MLSSKIGELACRRCDPSRNLHDRSTPKADLAIPAFETVSIKKTRTKKVDFCCGVVCCYGVGASHIRTQRALPLRDVIFLLVCVCARARVCVHRVGSASASPHDLHGEKHDRAATSAVGLIFK